MHACPCGFYGDPTRECRCTPATIQRYLGRISRPLLDRIDIHIEVPAVPYKELRSEASVENSATLRGRVAFARDRQARRGCNTCQVTRVLHKGAYTRDELLGEVSRIVAKELQLGLVV